MQSVLKEIISGFFGEGGIIYQENILKCWKGNCLMFSEKNKYFQVLVENSIEMK